MTELLRVAAVQLNSSSDLEANLDRCQRWVHQAAERGARLIVLPENFAFLGSEEDKALLAEPLGDMSRPIQGALSHMAREAGVYVVGGGFPERAPDDTRPFNTCLVVGPDGRVAGSYRKIHLFDVELPDGSTLRESSGTTAGSEPVVVLVDGVPVGLSVCYDLRFPELYRALSQRGAEVLLVPSAFTQQTGKDHWHVLLRARAVENQAWVVAPGQWGSHSRSRTSYGHSLVVDPWGVVVAESSDRDGVVVADLDRAILGQVRSRIPCLQHRRL